MPDSWGAVQNTNEPTSWKAPVLQEGVDIWVPISQLLAGRKEPAPRVRLLAFGCRRPIEDMTFKSSRLFFPEKCTHVDSSIFV